MSTTHQGGSTPAPPLEGLTPAPPPGGSSPALPDAAEIIRN